jgi:hypothetical protein
MRAIASCVIVPLLAAGTGCRFGENVAEAPVDGAVADGVDIGDAGDTTPDGPVACTPGADGDGDGISDCDELNDASPFTDPAKFNGLHAIIGDKPFSGNCNDLDDYAEMETRFDEPAQEQDVTAGWHFETSANSYNDPEFGFAPNWTEADSGAFSVRFRGQIWLTAGEHCFTVDVGATGTNIVNGHNMCGQVYVGSAGPPTAALVETGYNATVDGAHTACTTVAADGGYPIDIVLWLWEVNLWPAKLHALHCTGAGCTPSLPIPAAELQAAR